MRNWNLGLVKEECIFFKAFTYWQKVTIGRIHFVGIPIGGGSYMGS